MSGEQLIVDDVYFKNQSSSYYSRMGVNIIDKMLENYIEKMQQVKDIAIVDGETAEALQEFIDKAQSLKGCSGQIGEELKKLTKYFIEAIDDADDILF